MSDGFGGVRPPSLPEELGGVSVEPVKKGGSLWVILGVVFLLLFLIFVSVLVIRENSDGGVSVVPVEDPVASSSSPSVDSGGVGFSFGDGRCDVEAGEPDGSRDCLRSCGNGVCEQDVDVGVGRFYPEHYVNCGDCEPEVCGDGECRFYENHYICPEDC